MEKVVPVIHIQNEDEAKAFYLDKLDFELDFEWRHEPGFPVYMGIQKGNLYLHLSEHGKEHNKAEIYVFVDDIEKWNELLKEKDVVVESGPQKMPWGNTDMVVKDPFDNTFRLSQINTHKPTGESS